MQKAIAKQNYGVIHIDDCGEVVTNEDEQIISDSIDQYKGDKLQVWDKRESDGFYFVYCTRMLIGYWVHPNLIELIEQ